MTTETLTLEQIEARHRAHAELTGYRERLRAEREAKAKANESAEDEIARGILARREEEAKRAEITAELQRCYALREANIAAERERERQARLEANPVLRIAETPARRLAKRLRSLLGDDFSAFVTDFRQVNHRQLGIELDRVPGDERAEALNAERAAQAAKLAAAALAVPEPDDVQEIEILRSHGVIDAAAAASLLRRKAEINQGAL